MLKSNLPLPLQKDNQAGGEGREEIPLGREKTCSQMSTLLNLEDAFLNPRKESWVSDLFVKTFLKISLPGANIIQEYKSQWSHMGKKWDLEILAPPEHQASASKISVRYFSPFAIPIQIRCTFCWACINTFYVLDWLDTRMLVTLGLVTQIVVFCILSEQSVC